MSTLHPFGGNSAYKSCRCRAHRGTRTDARRPVPRLRIRSAEVRGGGGSLGGWEHNNKGTQRCSTEGCDFNCISKADAFIKRWVNIKGA